MLIAGVRERIVHGLITARGGSVFWPGTIWRDTSSPAIAASPRSDGAARSKAGEIRRWAVEHELPDTDGHVQFSDARRVPRIATAISEHSTSRSRRCTTAARTSAPSIVRIQSSQRGTTRVVVRRQCSGGGVGAGSPLWTYHNCQHRKKRWPQPRSRFADATVAMNFEQAD